MYKQLQPKSRAVLSQIKAHPGSTILSLSQTLSATHTKANVTQALWALWHGRYITRRVSTTVKGSNGMRVLEYFFKTEKPRHHIHHKGKPNGGGTAPQQRDVTPEEKGIKPLQASASSQVELLVALKGGKETMVLTVQQAKDLAEQLKQLGLA